MEGDNTVILGVANVGFFANISRAGNQFYDRGEFLNDCKLKHLWLTLSVVFLLLKNLQRDRVRYRIMNFCPRKEFS